MHHCESRGDGTASHIALVADTLNSVADGTHI
eukprot:COSAG04_NODE_21019_length_381_cov_1.911348_2_plen_31_part_01